MSVPDDILWAALPVPAILVQASDRISDSNAAAESFLNQSRKALVGASLWDKISVDAPLTEAIDRVRQDQSAIFVNDIKAGGVGRPPVPCQLQIAPVADGSDKVLLLISPSEITGQMARGSAASSAVKSAIGMAELLAHEIKNPLAGITGAAQLLSMNLSGEDQELTDLIVAESRRILKLLGQVEQFGNLLPPDRKPVNLHDVLDRARRSAMVGFAADLEIVEEYDPSLPMALADSDQLVQVFLNLLKNAAEAAGKRPGGALRIRSSYDHSLRLRRADGRGGAVPLQVEIIDNGPGLPPDIADDIFEPFVSGRENGTGLGLALVSKILSDHGGLITVNSRPGHTAFKVSLPLAPDEKGSD